MTKYNKENPSPDYISLQEQYRILYTETGSELTNGHSVSHDKIYANGEFAKEAPVIRDFIRKYRCETLLNFGCGNPEAFFGTKFLDKTDSKVVGEDTLYATYPSVHFFLDSIKTRMYDPGIPQLSEYPDVNCDIVVCTDVLEHIPEQDLDWFIAELINLANKVVHVTIHLGPAYTILPDGRNAHVTVKPKQWWKAKIEAVQKSMDKKVLVNAVYRHPIDSKGDIIKIDYSQY